MRIASALAGPSADTLIPDPQNPQSYNRYSYVENRPLTLSDPTSYLPVTVRAK